MPWLRLEDSFHAHPKIIGLSNAAVGVFVKALSYAGGYLTDGFVPQAWTVAQLDADEDWKLVQAGLWERVEGGFQIHDYLDYNPSKKQVLADRARKAKAGQKGGKAKARNAAPQAGSLAPASEVLVEESYSRPDPTRPSPTLDVVQADPILRDVVGRLRLVAADRNGNKLVIDERRVERALGDFSHLPDLRRCALAAADGLSDPRYKTRKDAARFLRNWLANDAKKVPDRGQPGKYEAVKARQQARGLSPS